MRKYGLFGTEVSPALIVQRLRANRVGSPARGVSRFRGVTKTKHHRTKEWTGRWRAVIMVQPVSGAKSKNVYLGCYDIELDAARAYDAALMTVEGIEPEDRNMPDDPVPRSKPRARSSRLRRSGSRARSRMGSRGSAALAAVPPDSGA